MTGDHSFNRIISIVKRFSSMTTEQHQEDFIAVFTHVITTPFGSEIEQSFACQLLSTKSV